MLDSELPSISDDIDELLVSLVDDFVSRGVGFGISDDTLVGWLWDSKMKFGERKTNQKLRTKKVFFFY